MATTYVDYTATAGQTDFNFSFDYLEDSHVVVEVEGVNQTLSTNYTIETSPTQKIVLSSPTTALAGGELVRIKRISDPTTDLVDFVNGSVLTETELDRAYRHNRYLSEEAYDGVNAGLRELEGSTNYNANNKQIKNLADGTLATDAVNKGYVDTQIALTDTNLAGFYKSTHTGNGTDTVFTLSFTPQTTDAKAYIVSIDGLVQVPDTDYTIGTTDITFNAIPANSAEICVVATAAASVATSNEAQVTATGSTTARKLADRFGERVNVKDFGAVADANYFHNSEWYVDAAHTTLATDNTAAFQAAVATGRDVVIPSSAELSATPNVLAGNYLISGSIGELQTYQTFKAEGWVRIIVDNRSSDFTVLTCRSNNIVENIWFDGRTTSQGTCLKVSGIGYTADDYAGATNVKNCWLRVFNKGYVSDNVFDVRFYDVQFRNCAYGAYLVSDYIATHYFNACRFYANSTNDVYLELTANAKNRVVTFEGCTFDPMSHATNTSCRLINASLVNWNNCYLEASTAGGNKQIEATSSINLSVNNCIMTKTGGISLDNSEMHLKNVWSFGFETDSVDHDPIVATNNSTLTIEDSRMRGTGHDFINGTLFYKIIRSTITLSGTARFYKHRVGGSSVNEMLELHDSSDNKILEVDQDSLNIVSGNLELAGNNRVYTGTSGLVSAGGALTFRLSAVDATIRPVMIKVFLQGRDTSNNAVTNQASCEYVFTAVNVVGGACQVSPVTTVHEYVFSASSHFSVTLNPSSLNDTIDVVLTNPVSGQTLNNTSYKVELLGSAWDLDSVTAS